MGNTGAGDDAVYAYSDDSPQHSVYTVRLLDWEVPVTRGDYAGFMSAADTRTRPIVDRGWSWRLANSRTQPNAWIPCSTGRYPGLVHSTDRHPVIGISYWEAEAFCKWSTAPTTEAQWRRQQDGTVPAADLPMGDIWADDRCNTSADTLFPGNQTSPVGSYALAASPYGCADMAGNVWEWCSDWYGSYYYSQTPTGG